MLNPEGYHHYGVAASLLMLITILVSAVGTHAYIDPTRPVVFSYPGLVPDGVRAYDILSMHYPGTDGSMEQYGKVTASFGHSEMPVVFDEWAHVACYNRFTVREDPNVRDFWGQSLDGMWRGAFEADGGLGGSIWGMVDETFMLPEELAGFNDWWGKIDRTILPGEYAGRTVGYVGDHRHLAPREARVLEHQESLFPGAGLADRL